MSTGWKKDKAWSDRFLPEMKRICGENLIGEPPVAEDQERNTDLMVLKMEAVRIAARVRHPDAWLKWPNEFTIRMGRPTGTKTEFTKIMEGWGDYLLYGFADPTETHLIAWRLISLNEFRIWIVRYMFEHGGKLPGSAQKNTDGSSDFHAFPLWEAPTSLLLADHDPRREAA